MVEDELGVPLYSASTNDLVKLCQKHSRCVAFTDYGGEGELCDSIRGLEDNGKMCVLVPGKYKYL